MAKNRARGGRGAWLETGRKKRSSMPGAGRLIKHGQGFGSRHDPAVVPLDKLASAGFTRKQAAFMDATRPIVTPEVARKLPPSWRYTLGEALETKYTLAYWAGLPQGIMNFDLLTDAVGPGAVRQGPSAERSRLARTMFARTCLEAPLYYCTEKITDALVSAATVLDDWTPTDELMPHQNGIVVMFERGIHVTMHPLGRFTGAEMWADPDRVVNSELRGLAVSNVYFGSYDPDPRANPYELVADEVVDSTGKFSARVKQWTHRLHMSGLMGIVGEQFPIPHDLAGWNFGKSLSDHRNEFDSFQGIEATNWRMEDEMESRLLGTLLLWIKQRILVSSPHRADRAARKRIEKMAQRPNPEADIEVIELRARDYIKRASDGEAEAEEVDWQCRWIVRSHWHKYRTGPHREIVQSKWVEAYIKGPTDKPLKPPKAQVFAVTR